MNECLMKLWGNVSNQWIYLTTHEDQTDPRDIYRCVMGQLTISLLYSVHIFDYRRIK